MDDRQSIVTLNPSELVKWCKERKHELGLSNADIAAKAAVPQGTVDRIFSGNYSEFRYSSVQPIIRVLIEINKDTPQPEDDTSEQAQYYYNTIEGYKLIVENKNYEISQLNNIIDSLKKEVAYLKDENEKKHCVIVQNQAMIEKMNDTINTLAKK